MSENKHTPEPWRAFNNGEGVVGVGTDHSDVCWTRIEEGGWLNSDRTIDTDYENARRIVACVNACVGVDTSWLESMAKVGGFAVMNNYIAAYNQAAAAINAERQRDELLAALERFMDSHEECTDCDGFTAQIVSMDDYHQAQEAIASVKGQK